jgi:hypothetical protein
MSLAVSEVVGSLRTDVIATAEDLAARTDASAKRRVRPVDPRVDHTDDCTLAKVARGVDFVDPGHDVADEGVVSVGGAL